MKIAFNLGTLRGYGSGTVGRNLLRELVQSTTVHEYFAWIPKVWGWQRNSLGQKCTIEDVKLGIVNKLLIENIKIRKFLRNNHFDCLFSMGDTSLPLCSVPHLLLVQQAYLSYRLNELDFPITAAFKFKLKLLAIYFRATLPTTTLLAVQTQCMKRRLCSRWNIPLSRVFVIPSSVEYRTNNNLFYKKSSNKAPYLCYIASPSAHKNFKILSDMMVSLSIMKKNLLFYLTVTRVSIPGFVHYAARHGVLNNFVFLGPLSVQGCLQLMANALAVVIPSKLESFGLPYYEAMALGCPVIAADRDFAREACGNAALYANANSGVEFAEAVAKVIESPSFASEMSERSRQQFAKIYRPWATIAREYLNLLEKIGNKKN